MSTRARWIVAVAATAVVAAAGVALQKGSLGPRGPAERVAVGTTRDELSTLIYLADGRGLFRDHGLQVEIRAYTVGADAVRDLLAGTVELATASDLVAARTVQRDVFVRILARVAKAEIFSIVARKDLGISGPAAFQGRRIGVHRGTAGDFFLSRMLLFNGLSEKDVAVVNVKTGDSASALAGGRVDAVETFQPHVDSVAGRLGPKAVVFPGQAGEDLHWLLLAKEPWVGRKRQAATRFLTALVEAEDLLRSDGDASYRLVLERLGLQKGFRSLYRHHVALDQPLLGALEEDTRWLAGRGEAPAEKMPNFLDYVFFDALDRARRSSDTVVR